jgi:hypothetical protein
MKRENVLKMTTLVLILTMVPLTAWAEISVGVKQGDWVEYDVAFTGTPIADHDVTWARMEIINIEGAKVSVKFISLLSDGTTENVTENLNLETGHLIDCFVISAGLKEGDKFFDEILGNILISNVEVRNYAGATRNTISGTTQETMWYWDQATGVLVEAHSSYPEYTITTVITKTGLWKPQILGLDPIVFYGLTIILAAVVVIMVIFIARRRRK